MAFSEVADILENGTSVKEAFANALWEAFEVDFDFWQHDGSWTCQSDAGGQFGSQADVDQLTAALQNALAADDSDELSVFVLREQSEAPVLVIPFCQDGRPTLVATAVFPRTPARILLNMARLFTREFDQRWRITKLNDENDAFVRQVTDDFEELTFLRGIAERLEVTELSFDLMQLGEQTLPMLQPLVDAKGILIVSATEQDDPAGGKIPAVGDPLLWIGKQQLSDEACRRLVELFRKDAEHQPVVRNFFHRTSHATAFPGLREFIMAPIAKASRVMGWLLAVNREYEQGVNPDNLPWGLSQFEFGTSEATLLSSVASLLATHARNVELFREKELLIIGIVRALVSAVEAKDEYTCGHSERVALYGKRLAEELGCSKDYCERLYLTGLLHDIGKIGVRDAVLKKPAKLTHEEFEEIKKHPDKGWAILCDLKSLEYVLPGVLYHHENWDGQGYPDQLAGENIPLEGRILAVVDAYDAMTSDRPYRKGMDHEEALAILRSGAGSQWDARIVEAFLRIIPEIIHIHEKYQHRPIAIRKR